MKERQKERAEKTGCLPERYLEKFRCIRVPCAHTIVKYENDSMEPTFYCAVDNTECNCMWVATCEDIDYGCKYYAPMLTCAYCVNGGNNQWHSSLKTHCAFIHQCSDKVERELEDQNDLSPCDSFQTYSAFGTYVDTRKVRDLHIRALYKEAREKKEHYGFLDENYILDKQP